MITRYVYIDPETQEILWGPGPMPYFIQRKDGSYWEITAHTVEESEAIGVYVIEQINYREFDPRFEAANLPVYSMVNGRPVETWSYEFIPPAVVNMVNAVDEYAETLRDKISSKFAGQMAEYEEAYNEAVTVASLPAETEISVGEFPFLEADVNVTFSPLLNRPVANVREAADLVIMTRNIWKYFGSSLRKARLLCKKQLREAESPAAAMAIYNEFANKTITDYLPPQLN